MTVNINRQLRAARTGGYTIDQTILIVAIIAILVTLIIISVGWQLINRTSGTKLASQFKQIEDANGLFYSTFRIWPDESYSTPATIDSNSNVQALAGVTGAVTYRATVPSSQQRNFIPGFKINGTTSVLHNFSGSGNTVLMLRKTNPFGLTGSYLVAEFNQVPFSEVIEAERTVDAGPNGTADYANGRVVASTGDCLSSTPTGVTASTAPGTLVNVCYAGNLTQ